MTAGSTRGRGWFHVRMLQVSKGTQQDTLPRPGFICVCGHMETVCLNEACPSSGSLTCDMLSAVEHCWGTGAQQGKSLECNEHTLHRLIGGGMAHRLIGSVQFISSVDAGAHMYAGVICHTRVTRVLPGHIRVNRSGHPTRGTPPGPTQHQSQHTRQRVCCDPRHRCVVTHSPAGVLAPHIIIIIIIITAPHRAPHNPRPHPRPRPPRVRAQRGRAMSIYCARDERGQCSHDSCPYVTRNNRRKCI